MGWNGYIKRGRRISHVFFIVLDELSETIADFTAVFDEEITYSQLQKVEVGSLDYHHRIARVKTDKKWSWN